MSETKGASATTPVGAARETRSPRASVAPRLFAHVAVTLTLVFVVLGVVAVTLDERARMESLEARADTISRLILASATEAQAIGGRLAIRDVERTAAEYPELVFTVYFDPDGEVIMAHGVPFVVDAGPHYIVAGRDEASAMRIETGDGVLGTTRRAGLVEARQRTSEGNVLVVGFTMDRVRESVRRSAAFIAVGLALALALVFVVTWRAVRREIATRVDALMRGADVVARGELTHRVALVGDDELSRLAGSFNAMTAELERTRRQQRTFFSSMGHELRAPVNAIRGFVDVVLSADAALSARTRQNLERVQSSADRMLRLVNEMLDLAKLEAGRLDVDAAEVSVREVVDDVVEHARALTGGRPVTVSCAVAPDSLVMQTDGGRLRQILLNLAANAVRFTPSGTVRITAARDDDHVIFVVADEGIGIAPEHQEEIFEAFRQLDGDGARAGGSGLGLAIVKQLTALLGGTVVVESAPHAGARFTVRLPQAHEPSTSA